MLVEIKVAKTLEEMQTGLAIRHAVFVREQGLDECAEFDGQDEASKHYLGILSAQPVATARVRPGNGVIEIERVAVLGAARGCGVGRRLLMRVIADCLRCWPDDEVVMSPQEANIAFYARFGFVLEGERFFDHGAWRRRMRHLSADEAARQRESAQFI